MPFAVFMACVQRRHEHDCPTLHVTRFGYRPVDQCAAAPLAATPHNTASELAISRQRKFHEADWLVCHLLRLNSVDEV
jgi:hypothetical protein